MSDGCNTTSPTAGNGASPANSPTQTCVTCTVSISPKPLNICGTSAKPTLTATGSPAGPYTWKSDNPAVATVSGGDCSVKVIPQAAGKANITVTHTPAGCPPCTDTVAVKVCTCTPKPGGGRYYSHAGPKIIADLIGAKAKIKTRYGKLCCEDEGCNSDNAFFVVYVNISNNSSGLIWAQTGWGRERNAGSTSIKKYRYAEMRGTPGSPPSNNYDTGSAPAEGSTHEYRCDLNVATGKWDFSFDGAAWEHFTDNGWKNQKGTDVQWTGEIYDKEDDMPGTSADKCNFTECQYRVAGAAYVDAALVAGDVNSSDSSEWGSEHISGTAFNIWDKKPL